MYFYGSSDSNMQLSLRTSVQLKKKKWECRTMEAHSKQNMCLLLMRACYYYRKSDDLIKKRSDEAVLSS